MEREPMDLEQAETLARAGNVGRVSLALLVELDRLRAEVTELGGKYVAAAQAVGRVQAMCGSDGTVSMADVRRALRGHP
jgi:hypothetical protein